jgi:hypothetical protein
VLLTILYLFRRSRKILPSIRYPRIIYIWSLIVLTYLSVSLVHYGFGGGFKISRGNHVFLMSRLIDMEIVNDYLQEECGEKNYRLCEYKDELIWEFLWDYENSPLYKTGGWEENREEYRAIIKDIFLTPKYLKTFLVKSVESSFQQFFNYETGDTPVLGIDSPPFYPITSYMKGQEKEYISSRQCNGRLDYAFLNNYQHYLFAASLLLTLLLLFTRIPLETKLLLGYILIALYLNALACGALSGVSPRYQSRVIFLLPLPILIAFTNRSIRQLISWKTG